MCPQLPSAVEIVMHALAQGLATILGDRLTGVYLGGSAAAGDFEASTSDIDFLVVTDGPLSPEDEIAVSQLHRELLERYALASRLEGDFAPLALLVPHGTLAPVPGCERGVFLPRVGEVMLSADNLYDMQERGLPFYGPAPSEILPTVTEQDVRNAVQESLLAGPGPYETPAEAAGEVLDLVRSLCALELGTAVTKVAGARWGLDRLGERWHSVIEAALAVRRGCSTPEQVRLVQDRLPEMEQALRLQYGSSVN